MMDAIQLFQMFAGIITLFVGAVGVSLTLVAIVSGVAPAIRAARVPPAEALRAG